MFTIFLLKNLNANDDNRNEEMDFWAFLKEDTAMANSINTNNLFLQYKNAGQVGKRGAVGKEKAGQAEDMLAKFGASASSVELSSEGLSALALQQKNAAGDAGGDAGNVKPGEEKLSQKAQDLLARLREKYGDYDFIVADDVSNPLDASQGSTKGYSVILSTEEIEKMAADEEYADKVMGDVEKAIGTANELADSGKLGEGVSFSRIAISIDSDGNMKLFAELERMSAEQQERLEAAKEKKAEEAEKNEAAEKVYVEVLSKPLHVNTHKAHWLCGCLFVSPTMCRNERVET